MDTDAIVTRRNNDLVLGAGVGEDPPEGGDAIQRMRRYRSIPLGLRHYLGRQARGQVRDPRGEHGAGSLTTAETLRSSGACARLARSGTENDCVPGCRHGDRGIPMKECAEIMLLEAAEHLRNGSSLETIYFVLFDEPGYGIFERTWKGLQA